MPWPDDGEVPTVKGGDLAQLKPLRDRDDDRVDAAETQVGVGLDQLRSTAEIRVQGMFDMDSSAREAAEEVRLNVYPRASGKQVADLGDYEVGHEERVAGRLEEAFAGLVVGVVDKRRRDERAGIDDDGAQTNPSASRRSSATRAEKPGLALPIAMKLSPPDPGGVAGVGTWVVRTSAARSSGLTPRSAASETRRSATSSARRTCSSVTPSSLLASPSTDSRRCQHQPWLQRKVVSRR